MSNNDDPFGTRDRTIIRPNPGGRRAAPAPPAPGPAPPSAPPPPPAGGARPAAQPVSPVNYPAGQSAPPPPPPRGGGWGPQYQGPPGGRPAPPAQPSSRDIWDWSSGPNAPPRDPYSLNAAPPPMTPAPIAPHISVDVVSVSTDPLMRSAASLLLMLGRLRSSMSQANPAELMDQVAQALAVFEREARAAGAPADQVQTAKFALSATADDIVQNNPNLDPRIWSQYSMEVRFLGTRLGGVKFFDELKRAKENASLNVGLLELMHACLSLGFEGKYRATGNLGELQAVRRDLYEALRRNRAKTIEDLSPHWRGQPIALAGSRFQIPIWAVASVALALLLVVYIALRWMLGNAEDALLNHVSFPHDLVAIARAAPVKPPPDPPKSAMTECQRITGALADDILAGRLACDQTATRIVLRIGSVTLFEKAAATVNQSFLSTAKKIAVALDKEPGQIYIDGYTDSDPIRTVQFPSNFELSQARAAAVAKVMKADLAKPDRVVVSGKADTNPIAPNDKEENKAKNRRVEISIERVN